jgi:hypothetical protein
VVTILLGSMKTRNLPSEAEGRFDSIGLWMPWGLNTQTMKIQDTSANTRTREKIKTAMNKEAEEPSFGQVKKKAKTLV